MKRENFTNKRNAIYNALLNTKAHPSAKTVYNQLKPEYPDLSLGTVYRNISRFKEKGMVVAVATVKGEERVDADTSLHAHFICDCCGDVIDVTNRHIDNMADSLIKQGFEIDNVSLIYRGKCYKCKK